MVKFVVAALVVMAGPAMADQVSPWFGSEGQVPFQLASNPLAETAMAEPAAAITSQQAVECAIEGCLTAEGSAKVLATSQISP
jgi:hypothetical protein